MIYAKLLELQKQALAIAKTEENPFFKSQYFDINKLLEVIKPVLSGQGLVLIQPLSNVNGRPAIKTILVEVETGEKIEEVVTLPDLIDSQKMGGAITYFRRYGIVSLLALESTDDDGQAASTFSAPKTAPGAFKGQNSPQISNTSPTQTDEEALNAFFGPDVQASPMTKEVGGKCPNCAEGKFVKNPKKGTIFCDKKCFLNK